jgi:hypothetical protein
MSIHLFVEIYAANKWKMIFFLLWKRMSEKEKGKNFKFKKKRAGTEPVFVNVYGAQESIPRT